MAEFEQHASGVAFAPVLDKLYPYNRPADEEWLVLMYEWRLIHKRQVDEAFDRLIEEMGIEN